MSDKEILKNSQIFLLGVAIALGAVASSFIIAKSMVQIKRFSSEVISVTGMAEKNIISDKIVWSVGYSRRHAQLTDAFKALSMDQTAVKQYLVSKGIKEDEITIAPVITEILYKKNEKGNDTNEIEAYRLTQTIEVSSLNVDNTAEVSRQATELIDSGIELISYTPEYFYTKLSDLKIEMLAKASEDARKRADNIASATASKVGSVRSAKMGVFQITPVNSYEISDYGRNDTSSYEKKVTAVVKMDFAIN